MFCSHFNLHYERWGFNIDVHTTDHIAEVSILFCGSPSTKFLLFQITDEDLVAYFYFRRGLTINKVLIRPDHNPPDVTQTTTVQMAGAKIKHKISLDEEL